MQAAFKNQILFYTLVVPPPTCLFVCFVVVVFLKIVIRI